MKSTVYRRILVPLCVVAGVAFCLFLLKSEKQETFTLRPASATAAPSSSLSKVNHEKAQVGTGWGSSNDESRATREALSMALRGKRHDPDFVFLLPTSGCDLSVVHSTAREILGKQPLIHGGTSDSQGVLTNQTLACASRKGFSVYDPKTPKAVAVLTVSSSDILFGVGSAKTGTGSPFASSRKAASHAVREAIQSAGKESDSKPNAILLQVTMGEEDEVLEGIADVVGTETIIQGGTTGGPLFGIIGNDEIYSEGLSVAVIYTDQPIGYSFGSSFEIMDRNTGVVTAADEIGFREINNRPALEVYDEWLGGQVQELIDSNAPSSKIKEYLTLHPICRKLYSSSGNVYYYFTHIWPSNDFMTDGSLTNFCRFKEGERIYLCHGTWEMLMNRFWQLPADAKRQGDIHVSETPIVSFGVICSGIMSVIPESERDKIPVLLNQVNGGGPFIASFNWGEQGYFPEVGNRHANLTTSFLVIGAK